jgi:hypothetical protein
VEQPVQAKEGVEVVVEIEVTQVVQVVVAVEAIMLL